MFPCHTLLNLILQDGYLRVECPYECLIFLRLAQSSIVDMLLVSFLISMNARSHQGLKPFELFLLRFIKAVLAAFLYQFANS